MRSITGTGSDPDPDPDLLRGVAHFCRQKLMHLESEESRLVRELAEAAVEAVKTRLRLAAESGAAGPRGPPWPCSDAMMAGESGPQVVAKQCRLRRVRELLRATGAKGSGVWLFWEPGVGGSLGWLGINCCEGQAPLGSEEWFQKAVSAADLALLHDGAVPAAANGVWQQAVPWERGSARPNGDLSATQFAFEVYAAAVLAWQSLLDWDLRRYAPGAGSTDQAERALQQERWALAEARRRVPRLTAVLAALRQDGRPALDAFLPTEAGNEAQGTKTSCPLVEYAASLVEMVRRVGRCRMTTDDGAVPVAAEDDVLGSMCVCLLGPPGTGKTRAARQAAGLYYGLGLLLCDRFVELGRADLVGGYVGETEEKTRRVLEGSLESFVLLDEAYALTGQARARKAGGSPVAGPGPGSGGTDYGPVALAVLLQFMTARHARGRVAIWAAGYRKAMMDHFIGANEGVSSRFPIKLDWPRFTARQLAAIALRTAQRGLQPQNGLDRCCLPATDVEVAKLITDFGTKRPRMTAREAEQAGRRMVRSAVVTGIGWSGEVGVEKDRQQRVRELLADPRLARGRRWLLTVKLREYVEEMDRVADSLRSACVTATVRRQTEAALLGQRLGAGGCGGEEPNGGTTEALLGPLRARFLRLRQLLTLYAQPPVSDALRPQPRFAGPCDGDNAGADFGLCGCAWINNRNREKTTPDESPWQPVVVGTKAWRTVSKRRRRVPAGLPCPKTSGVPWAAVGCPWMEPGFVDTHIRKAARFLWQTQTGFDTTRPCTAGDDISVSEQGLNHRAQALERATEAVCRMAAPIAMGQVSLAAVADCRTAAVIESGLARIEPGPQGWNAVLGYIIELLELVVACGDEGCSETCREALRDELGHMCSVVLMAPSGTGKTEAARAAAGVLYGIGAVLTDAVLEVGRHDLVASYVGLTEVKTARLLNSALESVLFIDEAYSLGLSHSAEDYGTVAAACLVQFMTARENSNRVAIWAAGYRTAMQRDFLGLNLGLSSRFPVQLTWSGLTPRQLTAIVIRRIGRKVPPIAAGIVLAALHENDRQVKGNVRTALRLAALVGSGGEPAGALSAGAVTTAVRQWASELVSGEPWSRRKRPRLRSAQQTEHDRRARDNPAVMRAGA